MCWILSFTVIFHLESLKKFVNRFHRLMKKSGRGWAARQPAEPGPWKEGRAIFDANFAGDGGFPPGPLLHEGEAKSDLEYAGLLRVALGRSAAGGQS
jgi:hypothetical protein